MNEARSKGIINSSIFVHFDQFFVVFWPLSRIENRRPLLSGGVDSNKGNIDQIVITRKQISIFWNFTISSWERRFLLRQKFYMMCTNKSICNYYQSMDWNCPFSKDSRCPRYFFLFAVDRLSRNRHWETAVFIKKYIYSIYDLWIIKQVKVGLGVIKYA